MALLLLLLHACTLAQRSCPCYPFLRMFRHRVFLLMLSQALPLLCLML
jgi:hypothetical protein